MSKIAALKAAIEAAGGQTALAKKLGVGKQNIHNWIKRGGVPDRHVLAIERECGVSRYEFCPDWDQYYGDGNG